MPLIRLRFKQRAVEMARRRDKPIAQLAKELGAAESGLRRWMDQADIEEGHKPGLTSDERRELVELRRKNGVLEMEVEILKRASALLRAGEPAPKIGFRFFGSLQVELLDRRHWHNRAELTAAIFKWIEAFYNPSGSAPPSATSVPLQFEALHTAPASAA